MTMPQRKKRYHPQGIPYKDAVKLFQTELNLKNALKEGKVTALGYHCYPPYEPVAGELIVIPYECWRLYDHNMAKDTLFGGWDLYGSDDPEQYSNIIIARSTIEAFSKRPGIGGARYKYDWDDFWRAVAFRIFQSEAGLKDQEGEDVYPAISLRDWVRNASSFYPYLWSGQTPSRRMLIEKLAPLFKAIKNESDIPLRDHVNRKKE